MASDHVAAGHPAAGHPAAGRPAAGRPAAVHAGDGARARHRSLPVVTSGRANAPGAAPRFERTVVRGIPLELGDHVDAGSRPEPRSVRISVTDRCDFACTYCRPSRSDGYKDTRLDRPSWQNLFRGLRDVGIRRVRLTGGEPLLVSNIVELVADLAGLGFEDIALTTNASQLSRLAVPLRRAGLQRLNISIDTLDPVRFARMTRGGKLAPVLAGIDAAVDAGFSPIKLNTVVLRGENDDELEDILLWAWARGLVPRFLELMPIAEGAKLVAEHLVTAEEMKGRLRPHLSADVPAIEPGLGPAKYVRARGDSTRRVGFITGTSDTFCRDCDRLRVSSTGVLRPCLATDDGVDASDIAKSGDTSKFAERLAAAWEMKPDGEKWKGCTEPSARDVSMRAIGG